MAQRADLDALLALGDVRATEVLALVPALVKASGGDVPDAARPLLGRLARAAGVRDDDDDDAVARKVSAFVTAHAPREQVKHGLFALAAGRVLDLVQDGAQQALARFEGARASDAPCDAAGEGVSPVALRAQGWLPKNGSE